MENVENMEMKLQDCCEAIVDCPHTTAPDEGEGYPLVRTPNIGKGRLIYNGMHRVSESVYKQRNKRMTPLPGDLIFAREAPAGNVAILQPGEFVCLGQRTVLLRVDKKVADSSYLAYYLLSPIVRHNLIELANGATVSHINIPDLKKLEISLPPLPTQRRIAAVLVALDDKIELNRKMNVNLEAQAQALFNSWFVDFAPWGGKMPSGWKKGTLGEIAEVNPLRSLKKGTVAPCVEMADLSTSGAYPDAINLKQYAGGTKFRNGDTIMARITPCLENGKAGFVSFLKDDEIGFGSTEYIVIASKSAAPSELFYSLVRNPDFVRYATKHMVGSSGRQRVSWQEIAEYELPIATNDFYESIAPRLKLFMEKMSANAKESRKLAELRDALLPKLMSGELEVA